MNAPRSRPPRVGLAVNLLYAGIALSVAALVLAVAGLKNVPDEYAATVYSGVAVGGVLAVGFSLFFTIMIAKGRNWARITFLVLLAVGVVFDVTQLGALFSANPVGGAVTLAETVLQITAAWLLFTGDAPAWFKDRPPAS